MGSIPEVSVQTEILNLACVAEFPLKDLCHVTLKPTVTWFIWI